MATQDYTRECAGNPAPKSDAKQKLDQQVDENLIDTTWHDAHPGQFNRMSKRHSELLRRRMSSMGPVIDAPKDISI